MSTKNMLRNDILNSGGGTYAIEKGQFWKIEPKAGYAVAMDGVVVPFGTPWDAIERLLRKIAKERDADYVGTWLDGDVIYLDSVYRFMPGEHALVNAMRYAYRLGQKAIYDFASKTSLPVEWMPARAIPCVECGVDADYHDYTDKHAYVARTIGEDS
jgi:hypothetical protein